jgi:hypothetical protein
MSLSSGARHLRGNMISTLELLVAATELSCALVAAQGNAAAGEARLTCYNVDWPASGSAAGPSTATATSYPITADADTCVRYQFTCTAGDSSCTGIPAGTTRWAYTIVSAGTCDTMQSSSANYNNVFCCTTDLCNSPDASLDPDTTAVDSPVVVIGSPPQTPPSPAPNVSPSPAPDNTSAPSPSPPATGSSSPPSSPTGTPGNSPAPAAPRASPGPAGPKASPVPNTNGGGDVTAFSTGNGGSMGPISTETQGAAMLTGSGNKSSAGAAGSSCVLLLLGMMATAGILL